MSDIDLDQLEKLEKAATPGPWFWGVVDTTQLCEPAIVTDAGDIIFSENGSSSGQIGREDKDFVLAIRNAAPDLIAAARAADAAREDINELLRVVRATASFGRGIPEPFGSMFRAIEAKYGRKEVGNG
jgi:hypothetical protein